MNQLGVLYQFELKKIVKRKLVWVTLLICMITLGSSAVSELFGTYWVDGEVVDTRYHMYQIDQGYRKALSGRVVNQALLEETMAAYGKIPTEADRYTLTEEYQTYARPYSEIFNLMRTWIGANTLSAMSWNPDEENLYSTRLERLEADWQSQRLSEAEKEFWRKKEAQIHKPITYFYHDGYVYVLFTLSTAGVVLPLFIAIALSSVFTEEHTRRMDQIILSSAKGKTIAYQAKMLAGITMAVIGSTAMTVTIVGLSLGAFGAAGFQAVLQLLYEGYSYPLTVGQACLITYGILILTSILEAVFVMVLSEILHSNLATLAVSSALIFAGMMIHIPEQYRMISQIWNSLPITFLTLWNIFDVRLISVFGHYFVSWQAVPVIYMVCGIVMAVLGRRVYQRYQVSGR